LRIGRRIRTLTRVSDRPFRFAVSQMQPVTAAEMAEQARRLEGDGFDLLYAPDHLGLPSPFPVLAAAATATTELRLGTLVCNNDFWNPVLLAREAATLSVLSGGRFELGLGAGHAEVEYRAAGIPYDRPAVRARRMAEAVPTLRRLLDGETVTATGEFHDVADASLGLEPVHRVPLLVGGNGDRVLALAAREADTVGITGFISGTGQVHTDLTHFTWDGLTERIAHVRTSAGDRFADLELQVLVQLVAAGDRREVAERIAALFHQPVELVLDSPFVMLGSVDDLVEHCERLRSLGVTALAALSGRGDDLLSPVVARVK
jgi:probable F420-dependent oxidoreductase